MTNNASLVLSSFSTFLEAMTETARLAKQNGQLYYLYSIDNHRWEISTDYRNNWLFQAYPGGRKILSIEGNERLGNLK